MKKGDGQNRVSDDLFLWLSKTISNIFISFRFTVICRQVNIRCAAEVSQTLKDGAAS